MRAVIFAAALLAATGGWLLVGPDYAPAPVAARPSVEQIASDVRHRYRAESSACKRADADERAACERRARQRLHAGVRREAALLSLR